MSKFSSSAVEDSCWLNAFTFWVLGPNCFLQRLRVPPFFFHVDVTSLVVYFHRLSVYLYFIHVLF
uniref:Uncharacterized protein n=1 Tax=Buteo japonicus TaxID=224669 RepID=A0A8C0BLP2_9AVES